MALGRSGEARELLEEALDLARKILPAEHPYIEAILDRLRRLSNFPPDADGT
jgi:hypothetical protein